MDGPTITLLIGITSCVVGVMTFITGRMTKAEHDGSMEAKIDQALDGIEDLKRKLETSANNQHSMELQVNSHEEKIKTLFKSESEIRASIAETNRVHEVLIEILHHIKNPHSS